ncbi:MAG: chorismate mutase [Acidaminobacteraceae bacterium]
MNSNKSIDLKRCEIDKLDSLLVNLLVDRFNLSKEISDIKIYDNIDNYDPRREEKIFENISNMLKEKGDDDKIEHIISIYNMLLMESKLYQFK